MGGINWQPSSMLDSIEGYGEYIIEIDAGVNAFGQQITAIIHAVHLDSIDCFWGVSADYYKDDISGFIDKDSVLRFVELDPYPLEKLEKE